MAGRAPKRPSAASALQFSAPGAVAQVEERSAGSRKVGGSSPPSSIGLVASALHGKQYLVARYCVGDVGGERGDRSSRLRGVERGGYGSSPRPVRPRHHL